MQDISASELQNQILMHLECLRLSGVEWLENNTNLPPQIGGLVDEGLPVDNEVSNQNLIISTCLPPIPVVHSLSKKNELLQQLKDEVAACVKCSQLAKTRKNTVFGAGKIEPDICFVGEAPGISEDEKGVPFVGEDGALLDKIIKAIGLSREEVYFLNIISCKPPDKRLPMAVEIANCKGFLEKQLALVKPKVICCLGSCAAENLLDTKIPVNKLRGKFYDWKGIQVLCTYHPLYLLRNPEKKKEVWEDMKFLISHLGRSLPTP
ncbi:MAG: uracil-DNA glycosylase [Planctomycetes bacterium]|nr:uracil-DNA glycosylase [Planctomycetota bacterium]